MRGFLDELSRMSDEMKGEHSTFQNVKKRRLLWHGVLC
jgi:hypothetical protein